MALSSRGMPTRRTACSPSSWRRRCATCCFFSSNLPGRFGGVLHESSEKRVGTLKYLHKVSVALDKLEAQKSGVNFLEDFWFNLSWAGQVWCREVLLGVREGAGEALPNVLVDELHKVGRCMKSTREVEMMFNDLRAAEHLQSANKMGRMARWYRCMVSTVPADLDRAPTQVTSADRMRAQGQIASSTFVPQGSSFSLGQSAIDKYTGPRTWASPKPDYLYRVGVMTESLLQAQDDLHRLSRSWLSLLAEPGALLVKAGDCVQMGLVLVVSPYGVILWKCHLCRTGDQHDRWWELDQSPDPLFQLLIDDVSSIKLLDVTMQPVAFALASRIVDDKGRPPTGMVLVSKGKPAADLLQFAARKGFHNLSMQHMRDLVAIVPLKGVAKPFPRLEHDLAVACIIACVPELSEADASELVRTWRGSRPPPSAWETVLDTSGLQHVRGILEEEDAEAIRKSVHTRELAKAVEEGRRQALQKGPRKPRKLVGVPAWTSFTREQAQKYCPDIMGCRVDKDEKLHFRWKIAYPCDSAPFSCTKVWNKTNSERQALMHVLNWAWTRHAEHTGESCPFNLDDAL